METPMNSLKLRRLAGTILVVLVLAVLARPPVAVAQATADNRPPGAAVARWTAWLGCWTPSELRPPARDMRLCVVPNAERTGVRLLTFAGDQVVAEETIVADGARQTTSDDGCSGHREVHFAAAGQRFFTRAELTCGSDAPIPSAMISTLTAPNRWLDVQVTGPEGRQAVRTARYTRSFEPLPAAVREQLGDPIVPPPVAIAPITVDDVTEAARRAPSPAVELWLAETEPRVTINRRTLAQLADAHVSEPVIDLLVGLAYPDRFRIRRAGPSGLFAGGTAFDGPFAFADPFGAMYGPWGFGMGGFGMYPWLASSFGASMFGSDFYMYPFIGSALYPWNAVPGGGGGGGGAIAPSGRGRVVNGQGYTRVEPIPEAASSRGGRDTGIGLFSGSSGDGGGGGGVSPGGYSSGGGGGGGGAGGGSGTAVPR